VIRSTTKLAPPLETKFGMPRWPSELLKPRRRTNARSGSRAFVFPTIDRWRRDDVTTSELVRVTNTGWPRAAPVLPTRTGLQRRMFLFGYFVSYRYRKPVRWRNVQLGDSKSEHWRNFLGQAGRTGNAASVCLPTKRAVLCIVCSAASHRRRPRPWPTPSSARRTGNKRASVEKKKQPAGSHSHTLPFVVKRERSRKASVCCVASLLRTTLDDEVLFVFDELAVTFFLDYYIYLVPRFAGLPYNDTRPYNRFRLLVGSLVLVRSRSTPCTFVRERRTLSVALRVLSVACLPFSFETGFFSPSERVCCSSFGCAPPSLSSQSAPLCSAACVVQQSATLDPGAIQYLQHNIQYDTVQYNTIQIIISKCSGNLRLRSWRKT